MKKNEKNYSIGLDIGTSSVGWTVIDEEDNIIKLNSKRHMWGVRLFDTANSAEERRNFRSNRRRMDRRKQRIILLQELLSDDINSKYPNFFNKLKLSKYHLGDSISIKKNNISLSREEKYNLFNDKDLCDKDFYKKYKTIYHLRNKLINSTDKEDIRLVYLALHHIIKYRGNFLYSGSFNISNISEIIVKLQDIINYICDTENFEINIDELFNVLQNKQLYKKQKIENILNLFNVDKDTKKSLNVLFRLIVGFKEDLSNIFKKEMNEKYSIRLTDDYDEEEIEQLLGENFEIFDCIKILNSWYTLQDILNGEESISQAFIKKYEKYQQDLVLLKNLYKKYLFSEYNKMFKKTNDDKIKNYYNYDNRRNKCSLEDFYKAIKKDFNDIDFEEKEKLFNDIDNENFLIRQNSRDNGAIPYQLHMYELNKILENQSKYYSNINENKEKIMQILKFRIPYYVGPLHNDKNQPNNWSIRNQGMEHTKVLPWNFEDVIDIQASANEFIRRMTKKCTYLPEEDVIPKSSLIYSEYCVLNELNGIKCDQKKLSKEEKELIIEKLFKVRKKVTVKSLKEFLKIQNNREVTEITGFQKENEFASSLVSYIDFKDILGKVDDTNSNMVEEIIEWITIFEDRDILKEKINEKYGKCLSVEQTEKILKKLKYTGWSSLSKKLLCEIKYVDSYMKKHSILDLLRETNYNFMQIINDKSYGFDEKIKSYQKIIESKKINEKFYDDNIATIPGSPANKRGIWQTLKVVDEIVKIMGHAPQNIYVEFAREDGEKKRTNSRRAKLQRAYDIFCNENTSEINKVIRDNLKNSKLDITDRMYLYFTQNGKCMYSGESLDFDNLHLYQVDHIIPQSKIKDDSFDNKVLVKSKCNQDKLDGYISDEIISNQKLQWKKLFEAGLISQTKYFNLLNNRDSDKRDEGFIKRQLVETRQITKYVTNIMQNLYVNTTVFSLKACLAHDFREKYDVFKIRELNDYHHAQDAYINAIIGSFINKKYPKMLREFIYSDYIKEFKKETNWNSEENRNKNYGFIISNIDKEYVDSTTGEIIDKEASKERIKKVLKQLQIKDIFITKKLEEQTGSFYKQNAISSDDAKKEGIEIKKGLNPIKYGAYTGSNEAYYVLFEYMKKDKKHFKVEGIPVRVNIKIKSDINLTKKYLEETLNYENVKIIKNHILKNQVIYKNDKKYLIVSSSEITIFKQLNLNQKDQFLLYLVLTDKRIKDKDLIRAFNLIDDEEKEKYENYIEDLKFISENKGDTTRNPEVKNNILIVYDWIKNVICMNIYDILADKIKKGYFEKIGDNLYKNRNDMEKLAYQERKKVIKTLLLIISGKSQVLNLIGGKSRQGRMGDQNMNEKWLKDVIFVEQSITGMYEKRFRINELENSNSI